MEIFLKFISLFLNELNRINMSEKPSTNASEQFLITARSINDYALAIELIKKVIDSPVVYSFGDLLEVPLIDSVS
jgi:hypothetical protein